MSKRIIFLVSNDLNYDQRMMRICSALQDDGYSVTLLGRNKRSSIALSEKTYKQRRLNLFFESGPLFYLMLQIRFLFYLLFKRTDSICAIDLDTILAGVMASKLKGVPIFYDAHEYFTEVPEVVNRPKVKRLWKRIEKFAVPRTHGAYTVCKSLADLFKEEYSVHFDVIRNVPLLHERNVCVVNSKSTHKTEQNIIIYQGALNVGRGLKEMIMSMPALPNWHLWLIGDGDLKSEFEELARSNAIKNVTFFGFIRP